VKARRDQAARQPRHAVDPAGLGERALRRRANVVRHQADDEDVAQLRASRPALVHQVAGVEQPVDEHQRRVQELAQHH
jgi:hypothetical protein